LNTRLRSSCTEPVTSVAPVHLARRGRSGLLLQVSSLCSCQGAPSRPARSGAPAPRPCRRGRSARSGPGLVARLSRPPGPTRSTGTKRGDDLIPSDGHPMHRMRF